MSDVTRDQVWEFFRAKTVTRYGRAVPLLVLLRVFHGWSAANGLSLPDDDDVITALEAAGLQLMRGGRGDWLVKNLGLLPLGQENVA
ncbi:hypothetical protein [Streptomyces sp. NPDC005795]|uniref:hypothetical protein n=1 Tax=Streptomyces sp. NPDC005795 TaxID=3154677 RepID=UPI0033D00210